MPRCVTTRYAACPAWASGLILAALVGLVLYGCLGSDDFPFVPSTTISDTSSKDVDLYRAIADRVRAGEGYYEATGTELRGRVMPPARSSTGGCRCWAASWAASHRRMPRCQWLACWAA